MNAETDYSGDPSIFRNESPKPSFSTSATATKKPKPGSPSLISRIFGNKPARATSDLDAAVEELAVERERVRLLVEELNRFTGNRDRAKADLALADERFEAMKADRANQQEHARGCWGRSIQFSVWTAYATILAMDAAIADFPKAREPLVNKLKEEEAALRAFQKENDLEETD